MSNQIAIADVLSHISNQLLQADKAARERGTATMRFDECELEFAIKVEGSAKAGIKVWLMELGGGVTKADTNTIRIKFKSIEGKATQAPHLETDAPGPPIVREAPEK
jgi:NTP-dependent ternary system trypsin peptidase co-occuring protein